MTKQEAYEICKEAIQLLTPIKAVYWIPFKFTNTLDKCCVIGHWTRLKSQDPDDFSENNCVDYGYGGLRTAYKVLSDSYCADIAEINNSEDWAGKCGIPWQARTPRARALAALRFAVKQYEETLQQEKTQ